MKIAIRADASLQIGSGHIMRCLTLADALKPYADILFLCRPHQGHLIQFIEQKGFTVKALQAPNETVDNDLYHAQWLGATQRQDAEQCLHVLESDHFDWMIVDHYALDKTWQTAMQASYQKLMVIDDLGDRAHLCHILLDQNYGSTQQKYEGLVPDHCQVLTGSQFTLLRPEFAQWREYSLKRRQASILNTLLINLGGVDADNLTSQLLQELERVELAKELTITVVMGSTAPHLEQVRQMAQSSQLKIEVLVGVNNMAELMANADLAIGAAGSTTWERCCLGLPTIQLVIAENQRPIAEALMQIGAVVLLEQITHLKIVLSKAEKNLKVFSENSQKLVDGKGALRVSQMLAFGDFNDSGLALIPYQSLTRDQSLEILAMRNHDEIRKWMHQQDPIAENTHFDFVANLDNRADCCFLVLKSQQKTLGTINFTRINQVDKSAEFGIFANPFLEEKGRGKSLLNAALDYAKASLKLARLDLVVFAENLPALGLYKKFGFVETEPNQNGHQVLIHMSKKLN